MLEKITKQHWVLLGLTIILAIPVLSFQPPGAAVAGLTGGFVLPLTYFTHILFFMLVGAAAVVLGRQAIIALPLATVMMILIGASADAAILQTPYAKPFLFSAVFLYAVAFSVGYSRQFMPAVAVSSAVAFYIGGVYVTQLPDLATMGCFLIGTLGSAGMLAACGVSLALAGLGYWQKLGAKLKEVPAMASFLSLF